MKLEFKDIEELKNKCFEVERFNSLNGDKNITIKVPDKLDVATMVANMNLEKASFSMEYNKQRIVYELQDLNLKDCHYYERRNDNLDVVKYFSVLFDYNNAAMEISKPKPKKTKSDIIKEKARTLDIINSKYVNLQKFWCDPNLTYDKYLENFKGYETVIVLTEEEFNLVKEYTKGY